MTASLAALAAASVVVAAGGLLGPASRHPASLRGDSPAAMRPAPAWVSEACRQLGTSAAPAAAWLATQLAAAAAVVATALVWGLPGALLGAAVTAATPRLLGPALARRRLAQRDAQVPEAMERVAAALRAGSPPGPALAEVAASQPAPLGDELRAATRGFEHGEALTDVLERWAGRDDASPSVTLAAAALGLGASAGGEVARAVDGVAATLRERQHLQAEVRALATQARTSARLLAAAPLGFAAFIATIEPGVLRFLVGTPLGFACLAGGILLDVCGLLWMGRIVGRTG